MKPFDLSKAQAGEPILLMLASEYDTTPVRLVGMLTDGRHVVERRAESGVYYVEVATEYRLRMAPKKRTVWVTLFDDGTADWIDEEAYIGRGGKKVIAGAIPIEIED